MLPPALAVDSDTSTDIESDLTPLNEVVVDDVLLPDLSELVNSRDCAIVVVRQISNNSLYFLTSYECVNLRRQSSNVSSSNYNNFCPYAINNIALRFYLFVLDENNQFKFISSPTSFNLTSYEFLYSSVNIYSGTDLLFEKNLHSFSFDVDTEITTENNVTNISVNGVDDETKGLLYYITSFLMFIVIVIVLYFVYKFFNMFFKL